MNRIGALIRKGQRVKRHLVRSLPCSDTRKSWLSLNQEAGPHQTLALPEL